MIVSPEMKYDANSNFLIKIFKFMLQWVETVLDSDDTLLCFSKVVTSGSFVRLCIEHNQGDEVSPIHDVRINREKEKQNNNPSSCWLDICLGTTCQAQGIWWQWWLCNNMYKIYLILLPYQRYLCEKIFFFLCLFIRKWHYYCCFPRLVSSIQEYLQYQIVDRMVCDCNL